MMIVGLKADVETVSRQLGHTNSSITLRVYSHEFDPARNTDQLRAAMSTCLWGLSCEAGDGARTHDPQLGKLMLYQLSYARVVRAF